MELVLPNNYVALKQEEMMYLEKESWIADSFAVGGAVASVASFISCSGTVSCYRLGCLIE